MCPVRYAEVSIGRRLLRERIPTRHTNINTVQSVPGKGESAPGTARRHDRKTLISQNLDRLHELDVASRPPMKQEQRDSVRVRGDDVDVMDGEDGFFVGFGVVEGVGDFGEELGELVDVLFEGSPAHRSSLKGQLDLAM